MSINRYAIIAAAISKNTNHHNGNVATKTKSTVTATATATETTTATAAQTTTTLPTGQSKTKAEEDITITGTKTKATETETAREERLSQTIVTFLSSSASLSSTLLPAAQQSKSKLSITQTKTSLLSTQSAFGDAAGTTSFTTHNNNYNNNNNNYDSDSDGNSFEYNSNESSDSSVFYGGTNPFQQQQNIRSGSGAAAATTTITTTNGTTYSNAINSNVNLLLGGAMLSLITTVLCIVCYCCHRSIKKRTEAAYRQQRQWLNTDPNMNIYSVEQCYDSPELFLTESNDGLATLPALRHEPPPPSYDAVIFMQEQLFYQQQRQHLQHLQEVSPPPVYHSSCDVSRTVAAAAAVSTTSTASVFLPHTSSILDNSSDDNSNHNDDDDDDGFSNNINRINNPFNSRINRVDRQNPLLNTKKVWNVQSCCSLQRAEVENMWNAAAVAVAARAARNDHAADLQSRKSLPTCVAMNLSLPATTAASIAPVAPAAGSSITSSTTTTAQSVERFGQHYLKQSYHRRPGCCRLCGKHRYAMNDEAFPICTAPTVVHPRQLTAVSCSHRNREQQHIEAGAHAAPQDNIAAAGRHRMKYTEDECLCFMPSKLPTTTATTTPDTALAKEDDDEHNLGKHTGDDEHNLRKHTDDNENINITSENHDNDNDDDDDDENGNIADYLGEGDIFECYAAAASLGEFYQAADEIDRAHAKKRHVKTDANGNATSAAETAPVTAGAPVAASVSANNIELVDLDSNENGFVRLKLSKLIDETGLPTYEAALKLDSSGYV